MDSKQNQLIQSFILTIKSHATILNQHKMPNIGEHFVSEVSRAHNAFNEASKDLKLSFNKENYAKHGYSDQVIYDVAGLKAYLGGAIANLEAALTQGLRVEAISPSLKDLHPKVYEECRSLFENSALGESVEKSFKIVRDRLRELTGFERGADAFGRGKLHIKGAAAPHVDKDFNEAVKFLTMAIDNFRNEKSHTATANIGSPARAYEYLTLSSLAMRLLEEAEIVKENA